MELVEDLVKEDPLQKLIVGNISKGWKPVRNPKSKYFITESQYPEEKYPDFATGPSYLVSKAAVEPLVEAALEQLYIHLEDVFITGVVAEKVHVERRNNEQFKNNAVRVPARFMGCTLLHTITIHKVKQTFQSIIKKMLSILATQILLMMIENGRNMLLKSLDVYHRIGIITAITISNLKRFVLQKMT